MKKLFLIFLLFSSACLAQAITRVDSIETIQDKQDMKLINELYIEGLKKIRHDDIARFRFRHARFIKREIKKSMINCNFNKNA